MGKGDLMIKLYSGTPGSGKSFHACKDVVFWMRYRRNVITNFPVDTQKIRHSNAYYEYVSNDRLTPDFLVRFAHEHNRQGHEGECLIVIDEAQLMFNSRLSLDKDRLSWITFFSQHRKLGFEVVLIAQSSRMLDRQIRDLIEDDVRHRKLNNYGLFGFLIGLIFLGKSVFYCCDVWMGTRDKVGGQWLLYNRRIADIYDTYRIFSADTPDSDGVPLRGGAPVAVPVVSTQQYYVIRMTSVLRKYIEHNS